MQVLQSGKLSLPTLSFFSNRSGYRPGIEDFLFEKLNRLNLETVVNREILKNSVKSNIQHATYYQPISCRNLDFILRKAHKAANSTAFDFFIDLGAGKGKACFFAAKNTRIKKIVGVEFSTSLVKAADRNKAIFGRKNITFLNKDAAEFFLPSGKCLVFLFNPFDDIILEKFIANNYDHFKENDSTIAYAYDVHRECLLVNGFRTIFRSPDRQVSLYKHRLHFAKPR